MSRLPSWERVAAALAERMSHYAASAEAHCGHPETQADPDNCPFCADRAAYRMWERKAGRR